MEQSVLRCSWTRQLTQHYVTAVKVFSLPSVSWNEFTKWFARQKTDKTVPQQLPKELKSINKPNVGNIQQIMDQAKPWGENCEVEEQAKEIFQLQVSTFVHSYVIYTVDVFSIQKLDSCVIRKYMVHTSQLKVSNINFSFCKCLSSTLSHSSPRLSSFPTNQAINSANHVWYSRGMMTTL